MTKKICMAVNFSFFHTVTVWKNEKISLTEKKFRQINYLVISLLKPLFSRNICEKRRENFCNFHTEFVPFVFPGIIDNYDTLLFFQFIPRVPFFLKKMRVSLTTLWRSVTWNWFPQGSILVLKVSQNSKNFGIIPV